MNTQDRYTIEILDMGTGGEGIGRAEGMAVFVNGTIAGDKALVEISQVKKSFARANLIEIVEASPQRIKPACPYAGACGGCSLQAMSYEGQLELKKKWVTDRLARIGGIVDVPVEDTIGMYVSDGVCILPGGIPIRYRNKAQFPIQAGRLLKNALGKYRNNKPCSVGFFKPKSHEVVNCDTCLIQAEPAEALARAVKRFVEENTVSVYDEKTGMGLLRHLIVKSGFKTGEVMAIVVVNAHHVPKPERLVELFDEAINGLAKEGEEPFWSLESVVLNVNKGKSAEVMGKECITIAGKSSITDYMGGLQFEISPKSFYQVNPIQMKKLYNKIVEFAQLTGEETVLDLYCGVGTIGLYCAKKAGRIIGIEAVKQSVFDANRNAVLNGIVNAEFICGRAEEVLPKRLSGLKADVVILDPPRTGCEPLVLETVLELGPKRMIYVSCDPATLARDIKILIEGGYKLGKVQPVDMFPGSNHVECVVGLQRVEK